MSDPLSIFPFAIAAGTGTVNDVRATALVAAGVTLLQRCAPLVRALAGRRAAFLLPFGPAFLTALAASDGRETLVLDQPPPDHDIGRQLALLEVGAVFTIADLGSTLLADIPTVILDHAPETALLRIDGSTRTIDLGTHHGLLLEGSPDAEGSLDRCLSRYASDGSLSESWTHRALLGATRDATTALGVSAADRVAIALPRSAWLPALVLASATVRAGGAVTSLASPPVAAAGAGIGVDLETGHGWSPADATIVAADAAHFSSLLDNSEPRASIGGAFRHALLVGSATDPSLTERFLERTGSALTPWSVTRALTRERS